ncbi:NUMOD4 domain-containing protein [Robertmurraya beringensis]|uniref:NUMOD4 domain-containing protein n=1 Tax=Robertmurraya beringensis TaxID=641660 RepID=A0ABV6KSF0_9BACI
MALMGEVWKDNDGYEGLQQVSSRGRVKRLDRYKESFKFVSITVDSMS